ncbi:MAG: hypothetical protein ABI651_11000 [Verrucomicrobiota bacterium]
MAGQQFLFSYDTIGDRTNAQSGGDVNGLNLGSCALTPNAIDQYASRTVPASFDLLGVAQAEAMVSIDGSTNSVTRKGEYYHRPKGVANSSVAVWLTVTNTATAGGSSSNVVGNVFTPKTPENFTYDNDGNLTGDGRFSYSWDAENRLIRQVVSRAK